MKIGCGFSPVSHGVSGHEQFCTGYDLLAYALAIQGINLGRRHKICRRFQIDPCQKVCKKALSSLCNALAAFDIESGMKAREDDERALVQEARLRGELWFPPDPSSVSICGTTQGTKFFKFPPFGKKFALPFAEACSPTGAGSSASGTSSGTFSVMR